MQYTIRLFFFSAFLISGIALSAHSEITPNSIAGHRIDITNIEVIKRKNKSVQIYVDVVNTGRFDIQMGEGKRLPYLEVGFDNSLQETDLEDHQDAIRKKLLTQNIRIRIGETKKRVFLKVKFEKKSQSVPEYSIIPPVEKGKENYSQSTSSKKEIRVNTSPSEKTKSQDSGGGFSTPKFKKKSLEEIMEEKAACPDLIIESVRIVKSNGKKATLEYVVKNIGKGPANLYDHSDEEDQPLGIRAYISGSPQLSKGSFPIDGNYINSGLGSIRGMLHPNETLTLKTELDIRRKTRYMQVIILSVDAFLKLRECDRTNNTNHVILE